MSRVGCSIAEANGIPLVWLRISRTVIGVPGLLQQDVVLVLLGGEP